MQVRFYNARILTMEDFNLIDGEVWVEENKITYVGEENDTEAEKRKWDRQINANGNLLMPGFKNAHTHSGMTFLRSYADDLPLLDWLQKQVFPMEAKLTPEDIYYLSILAIMEYLTSGITANFDMYLTPDTIAQASIDCGFRTVLTSGLNDFTQSIDKLEEYYEKFNSNNELIRFCLGFHAEYTTSRNLLEGVAKLARKYEAPVFTHNSETKAEVRQCLEKYGVTPTRLFEDVGIYAYGGGGYHCVHMSEEDLNIFKMNKLTVVTNPGSNVKLASGIAPVQKMLDLGINVAIGTDGPASNNCLDMFREMFLTTGLAKLCQEDASAVDAHQVLRMATVGGAIAMGLADCDVLAKGKNADLIMLDLNQPNMQPLNNIPKNIVYSGSKHNIKLTMVNGKILYEDGRFFIGFQPDTIYKNANDIVRRIKNSI
ncbi:MAG: amidohydrolase [Lachnospiraceae bacterium]